MCVVSVDKNTIQSEPLTLMTAQVAKDFNDEVKRCIDGAVFILVGQDVLKSLYGHLKEHYDITPDKVAYRLHALFETLEQTFGVKGARTLSRAIAKRLYYRFDLQFVEIKNGRLQDYVEQAKKEIEVKL